MPTLTKILEAAGDWVYSFVVACALALLINVLLFQPTTVIGPSMNPTLHSGQYILISKLPHTFGRPPAYGDIVVVDSRVERRRDWRDDLVEPVRNVINMVKNLPPAHNMWVKRVIGLPGDKIEFKAGQIYRNGAPLAEPYLSEPMAYQSDQATVVPPDRVYVLGDNRNNSTDSRYIGSVPLDHVMGVMFFHL